MLNLHQDLLVQYLHFTMIVIITYLRKQLVRLITIPSLITMYMFITMVMTMIIVMTVITIKSNSDDDDDDDDDDIISSSFEFRRMLY